MNNNQVSQSDSKEKTAATKVVAKALLLKVIFPGQLSTPVSNDLPRETWIDFLRKIDPSYVNLTDNAIGMVVDSLGKREKKRLLIANLEKVPYFHANRDEANSYKVVKVPAESVADFINEGKVPERIHKNDWKHWSAADRLRYHLDLIADGNKFEFEYVEA
jgi:hypothetical protein